MKTLLGIGLVTLLALVGCSSTNVSGPGGSGGGTGNDSDGGSTAQNGDGSSSADGGASSSADGGGGNGGNVVVSTTAAPITFGSCPTFNPCGGDLQGTWDYTGGCVADPFTAVTQQCPTATTSNVSGTVVGTVDVLGSAITRNAKATFTGTVNLPAACTMGASCAVIQSTLVGAGYDSVTCTGTTSCSCVINGHTDASSVTTFTQNGSAITTADGATYDICVAGNKLTEQESGNQSEPGAFTLTLR